MKSAIPGAAEKKSRLLDVTDVERAEVIRYKRALGVHGNLCRAAIDKDADANLAPSPHTWWFGGLTEEDFLNLVFYRPDLPSATRGGTEFLLRQVARNYMEGKTQGIDTGKVDWFRSRIRGRAPTCGFRPVPPLQLDGWINDKAPCEVREMGMWQISDGYHRALAYATLLVEGSVSYQTVFAYVRPRP